MLPFSDKIHKLHTSLLLNHACSFPHIPPPVTPPHFSSFAPVTMDEIFKLPSDSPEFNYDLDPIPTPLPLLTFLHPLLLQMSLLLHLSPWTKSLNYYMILLKLIVTWILIPLLS